MSSRDSRTNRADMRTEVPGPKVSISPAQRKSGPCIGMAGSSAPTSAPPSDDPEQGNDRPTSIPTYDVEQFARQHTGLNAVEGLKRHASEARMLALLAKGNAEQTLDAVEMPSKQEANDALVLRYQPLIHAETETEFIKTLGSMLRIPRLSMAGSVLSRLPLDHRAGFVLSHVDGVSDYETILAICGMPRMEALRALCELLRQGAIAVS